MIEELYGKRKTFFLNKIHYQLNYTNFCSTRNQIKLQGVPRMKLGDDFRVVFNLIYKPILEVEFLN